MTPRDKLQELQSSLIVAKKQLQTIENEFDLLEQKRKNTEDYVKKLQGDISFCSTVADQYDEFEKSNKLKREDFIKSIEYLK